MRNILVTTKHRGVFCAKVDQEKDLTSPTLTDLKDGRMVIRWRNQKGLQGMANFGPTENCKLSPKSDIAVLHDVTAIFDITDEAAAKIWSDEG